MGDKKFTLVELHLDGNPQFGPRTISEVLPFGADESAETAELEGDVDSEEDDEAAASDDESGGPSAVGALVALAVLVAAGVAVKRYRGDDEEEFEEEEQPDVIVN